MSENQSISGRKTSSQEKRRSMNARSAYLKQNKGLFGCIYICPYCLRAITKDQLAVDHIRPLADEKGKNVRRNLVGACKRCNAEKRDQVTRSYLIRGSVGRILFRALMILQSLVSFVFVVTCNLLGWLVKTLAGLLIAPFRSDNKSWKVVTVLVYLVVLYLLWKRVFTSFHLL